MWTHPRRAPPPRRPHWHTPLTEAGHWLGTHHVRRAILDRDPCVAVIAHQDLVGGHPVTPEGRDTSERQTWERTGGRGSHQLHTLPGLALLPAGIVRAHQWGRCELLWPKVPLPQRQVLSPTPTLKATTQVERHIGPHVITGAVMWQLAPSQSRDRERGSSPSPQRTVLGLEQHPASSLAATLLLGPSQMRTHTLLSRTSRETARAQRRAEPHGPHGKAQLFLPRFSNNVIL